MRCGTSFVAIAMLLVAAPCRALDIAQVDIVGLRLGMPEVEIVVALRHQGFAVANNRAGLTANTRDGRLTVDLDGDHHAQRIRYVFDANGLAEPEKILTAVLDRFGPPNQTKPMTWCRVANRDGICPDERSSLTFLPDKLTLLLRSGTQGP